MVGQHHCIAAAEAGIAQHHPRLSNLSRISSTRGGRTCLNDRCYRKPLRCRNFLKVSMQGIADCNHDRAMPVVFEPTSYTSLATRIGEASNPGPLQIDQFRIGFVNPTTVLHRENTIQQLDLDLLGLAETSATKPAQISVKNNLRKLGYYSHWSLPVDNHRPMINGQDSLRGVATGVAIVSKIPTRTLRDPLPPMVMQSSRVIMALAQLGATTILTAVFYGFASGNEHAREETNNLLEIVIEQLLSHPGPVLLMGDFNHDPLELPALSKLQQAGYTSIIDLHQQLYKRSMPKTYQEATTRDLMFFSTELSGHVTDIQVHKDTEFPGHCPVIVEITLPLGGLTKQMWRIPKNFMELSPSKVLIEHAYESLPKLELFENAMDNLQRWTRKVEKAVDLAIQKQHRIDPSTQPHSGLPKQYQGKFSPTPLKTCAFRAFTPKARVGDFEPNCEVRSIVATQQVRQVRRIQSLRRRFTKLQSYTEVWPTTWKELQQEWKAILKAPGFDSSFVKWVCNTLRWPFVTLQLPTIQILEALEEAVKAQTAHTIQEDQKRFMEKRYVNHQIDHLYNYDREAYKKVQEPPLQYIQSLITVLDMEVTVSQQDQKFVEITGDFPKILASGTVARTPVGDCIVLQATSHWALMKWRHIPDLPPLTIGQQITIEFESSGMQPNDIHAALIDYWQPLWNRESNQEAQNESEWNIIAEQLQQHPIPKITGHFDLSSIELWKTVIQKTNSQSVPGADGWYFDELKALPNSAILELSAIFQHSSFQGFESPYMRARIVPLPKKQYVETPDQTRPITVMPTIYRVWSAVVAHQIMKDAHNILPEGIVGFVKGRSGLRAMHKLAY